MRNLHNSVGRVRRAAAVGAFALVATGLAGCGSSSPVSCGSSSTKACGTATTVSPGTTSSPATTASPATTTAPTTTAPTTTSPPTTAPSTTTAPATTPPTSGGSSPNSPLAQRYKAIIGTINESGSTFGTALDGYPKGTTSLAQLKAATASYVAASKKLQTSLLAVHWSAPVQPLIYRLVGDDKKLVGQVEGLESVPRSKFNARLTPVSRTLITIHTLSNRVRKDLGLPQVTN